MAIHSREWASMVIHGRAMVMIGRVMVIGGLVMVMSWLCLVITWMTMPTVLPCSTMAVHGGAMSILWPRIVIYGHP